MRPVFHDSGSVVRIGLVAILSIVSTPMFAALKEVEDDDARSCSAEELLENYDLKTGVYSVCVDLTGVGSKKGAMDIDECVAHTDFKKMIGSRQYRDKNGDMWLLGIGMADADVDDAKQKSARDALLFWSGRWC